MGLYGPELYKAAVLSECGSFRYHLSRGLWSAAFPPLLFIMLNPSTADAANDDPTIRRCVGFARRMDFGSVEVVNLFAYRATDPAALARAGWPQGPDNMRHIRAAALRVVAARGRIVCAWGANARGRPEAAAVIAMLRSDRNRLYALRLLRDGTPAHPLMLPYTCELQELPA